MGVNRKILKLYIRDLFVFLQIIIFVFAFPGVPEAVASVSYRASSAVVTSSANAAAITLSQPTGTQVGDLLIMLIANTHSNDMTPPTGWTTIQQQANGSIDRTEIAYLIATSTSGTHKIPAATGVIAGFISGFIGASTTAPIATSTLTNNAAGTTAAASGLQTAAPGTMAVMVTSVGATNASTASYSGSDLEFVEAQDGGTNTGSDMYVALAYSSKIASTTNIGRRTATVTSNQNQAGLILIRPNVVFNGTLYSDEGMSPITSGSKVIKMSTTATSTVYSTTTNSGSGNFTFNGLEPFPEGSAIRVWVDGDANTRAFTQTKASTTCAACYHNVATSTTGGIMNGNISGLNLYQNRVILRTEAMNGTTTENSDLARYDGDNDPDIQFKSNHGSGLHVNSGQMLYLWPGSEFKPGSSVTIHGGATAASQLDTDGSLKLAYGLAPINGGVSTSSILSINGQQLNIAGSFFASSTPSNIRAPIFNTTGTTTFNATSTVGTRPPKNIFATSTINYLNGAFATSSFYNVEFGTTTAGGGQGSWAINNGGTTTVTNNFYQNTGTTTLPSSVLEIGGNFFNNGRIFAPLGTTTFNGTTTQYLTGFMVGTSTLNNVEFSATGTKVFANNASTTNLLVNRWNGTTAADSSGIGVTGTATGTSWADGKIKQGYTVNGGTSYLYSGTVTGLAPVENTTVALWANLTALDGERMLMRLNMNGSFFYFRTIATELNFANSGAGTHSTSGLGITGGWHHFAGTWDETNDRVKLYYDGVNVLDSADTFEIATNSNGELIAGSGSAGVIDDVRVYDRVLTQAQITELSTSILNPPVVSPGLLAWWKLDDGITFTAPSLLSISGNYLNYGKLSANSGTVYLASTTAQQSADGYMTADSAFSNLTILNNSGTDATTSPSVIFRDTASTTGTFTAITPNTKIQFPTLATTTINNLTLSGQAAGTKIMLRGATTTGGVDKFGLEVSGTESISYTDFMDTNACRPSGVNLAATDGTNQNSGNNSCIGFSVQSTLNQSNYQWFINDGNISAGGEKASLNSTATILDGTVARLRMNVLVGGAALSGQAFDLQFKTLGAGCGAGESWTAVGTPGSATIWRGYDNSTLSDGANLTTLLLPNSNTLETYEENGLAAGNPTSIAVGDRGEWDWVVQNNGATAGTTYCFKMIKNGGSDFTHGNYPQVIASSADVSRGGSSGSGGAAPANEVPVQGGQNNQGGGGGGGGEQGGGGESPTPPPPGGGGQGGGGGGGTGFAPLLRFFAAPYYFIENIFGLLGIR